MSMQRQGRRELLPFDPEPERTIHRLHIEAHATQSEIMQNQEDEGQVHERNEPQVGQNGQNHRNQATRSFVLPNDPRMLLEEFTLPPTVVQSAIRRPPIQENNFKLKGVTLQMHHIIQFHGLPRENPNAHLTSFIEVCDTVKYNGVTEEALRLRLFPLSLSDRTKHWLTSQPPDSITSWNDLVQKFRTKFFPPSKIAQLVQEINTFGQFEGENLAEAWERFHELLRRCPHHSLTRWMQVHRFYNGLGYSARTIINALARGALIKKTTDQAYEIFEDRTINTNQWPRDRSAPRKSVVGADTEVLSNLVNHVAQLTKQLQKQQGTVNAIQNNLWEICESCGGQHNTMDCQSGQMIVEQAQYVNQQNQQQQG